MTLINGGSHGGLIVVLKVVWMIFLMEDLKVVLTVVWWF